MLPRRLSHGRLSDPNKDYGLIFSSHSVDEADEIMGKALGFMLAYDERSCVTLDC